MAETSKGTKTAAPLLALIEQRFGLVLETSSASHLRHVAQHYAIKREMLLREHGEAGALAHADYAKAVLLSETARLILREIAPKRRKKSRKD